MHIDLRGKVAVVTGAGRGIGREIAVTLAGEGVVTHVTDMRQDLLDAMAADWESRGWRGGAHHCDARDARRIEAVVAAVVAEHGRLDILVNNAGVAPGGPSRSSARRCGTSIKTSTAREPSSRAGR